ncbi:hypothetical protein BGZ96_002447 [Linnemannia gamsii]|uniref:C2H2-type domain-containing protein n=1 Tax=Linnemannia gamsii TaxID=64522 RepID=A0ABQ7JKR7_9FUNG|nr:hypothetical protein BGZ96_002447 [Linnemannia gamsii]
MSSASSPLLQSATKDNATTTLASTDALAYPSPSHSPATTYQSSMQPDSFSIFNRRRSSVKALLKSANPPASPLDALVMALEATVEEEEEEEEEQHESSRLGQEASMEEALPIEDEEDPDATIPSSPTLFMKRPATDSSSLHHLPTMYLPEPTFSTTAQGPNNTTVSGLTPSTLPKEGATTLSSSSGQQGINNRKMSISSQGSSSSAQSNGSGGERTKEYGCTIGNCEKKFYQVAHLRSHER